MKTFTHQFLEFPQLEVFKESEEEGRWYKSPNGILLPSVTTILGSEELGIGLQKWKEALGEEEANRFMNLMGRRGDKLHKTCEKILLNDSTWAPGLMPDMRLLVKGIIPFLEKLDNIMGIEAPLFTEKYGYAGRTDLIASFDKIPLAIVDYKTSNSDVLFVTEKIEKYLTQTAAYAIAFEEMFGVPINHGVLIFATNDYEPKVIVENIDSYKPKFLEIREQFQRRVS